jgi:hypothetical protein
MEYDPGYYYEHEDDEEIMMSDDDGEWSSNSEDFNDESDTSWKVRLGAAKVILSISEGQGKKYLSIDLQRLLSRFKERDENI